MNYKVSLFIACSSSSSSSSFFFGEPVPKDDPRGSKEVLGVKDANHSHRATRMDEGSVGGKTRKYLNVPC